MSKPMIKGGVTDQVMRRGGEQAYFEVAAALAGKDIQLCVYALTRAITSVGLNLETEDQAIALAQSIADDVVNELRLNWSDREELLAGAKAAYHPKGGRA